MATSSKQADLFSASAAPPPSTPTAPEPEKVSPPPAPAGPRVLTLIDASGFIFRAFHALPPFSTSKGVPTNATLGFTRMLLKVLRERRPPYVALCFDKDSRRGRLAIDPQYKANRSETPDELKVQFEWVRKVATALELPSIEAPGWEADDVIATLVRRAKAEGFDVEIISSDKDLLQLLGAGVKVWDPAKEKDLGEAEVLAKFGVKSTQLRDYQALVGDAVDNVPKVPGVGPKTAADLLNRFGDLDTLLSRTQEIEKPKLREAIESHLEQIARARKLVSFQDELPLDVTLEGLARREFDAQVAKALFLELEFYRLIDEMPRPAPSTGGRTAQLVSDEGALVEALRPLRETRRLGMLARFEGEPHSALLTGLALGGEQGEAVFVDVRSCGSRAVAQAIAFACEAGVELVAPDAKALLHVLRGLELDPRCDLTDVPLLSFLLSPSRKDHRLETLARERLQWELPPEPGAVKGGPVGPSALAAWAGAATEALVRLAPTLWQEIDAQGLMRVARDIERPLTPVLVKMERAGVKVDRSVLADISTHVDAACDTLLKDVYRHAGRELNVGSPAQLAQVLFEELKLPVIKKGKTGPSTDHEVLEKLAEQHPLPQAIIEYRNVSKLKSTYLDTLPGLVDPDGRIRTTFNQAGAATGRLSSVNPNLQNIPIRTELGGQLRRAFVAEKGFVLVSADYSQIELRILAHYAKDEALVQAFAEGADVHARTAAEVFGVPLAEVTAEHRRVAKMVNYGIAYGLSAHGLSARLNIPAQEAKSIIDRYFARFTGIAHYIEDTVASAKKKGYVETLYGRRRDLPDLVSKNRNVAMAAERAAINMPIQGTAADLIKLAMLELERRLASEKLEARMLLQVHDELLLEAPEAQGEKTASLAREVMSTVEKLAVPLLVDVGLGQSWAEAH